MRRLLCAFLSLAFACLLIAVGLGALEDCPACDPDGLQCPDVAQFALFAKIRGACSTNAQCARTATA